MSGISVGQVGVAVPGRALAPGRVGSGGAPDAPFGGALDEAIDRASAPRGRAAGRADVERTVREAAEELVAGALVRPVLAKMRETSQAAPPFAPGRYEKTFAPLLDAEISTRIVRSERFPLVDAMTEQLMARVRGGAGNREVGNG